MVRNFSDIPALPKTYIPHPYRLLGAPRFVGRQSELNLLTDWVAKPEAFISTRRILNIVSTGGMGKSALAWQWFNDIAPQEMQPLAGRIWWSFYENDATFERFVTSALAYVTQRPFEELQELPQSSRETNLFDALDREPFLIVLDGLELALANNHWMNTAHPLYEGGEPIKLQVVADISGQPADASQSLTSGSRSHKAAFSRSGNFLRKLASVRASRILALTRISIADFLRVSIDPWPECNFLILHGLTDADAIALWGEFGVSGAGDSLLRVFNSADNHPLLIQILAGCVAGHRQAPGNFEDWRSDHPDFNRFNKPLSQVKSDIFRFALDGLDEKSRQVLGATAAFPMPAQFDSLVELLANHIPGLSEKGLLCTDQSELDLTLTELEHRGILGWNRGYNRCDLHPIVRSTVWSGFSEATRRSIYATLSARFEASQVINRWQQVQQLPDPEAIVELANVLGRAPEEYQRNVTMIWPR